MRIRGKPHGCTTSHKADTRRLSDLGLIYRAGGRAPHFPDPVR